MASEFSIGRGNLKVEGLELLNPAFVRARCEEALWQAAFAAAKKAKSYLGHQQSWWPPLAASTLKQKGYQGWPTEDGGSPLYREGSLSRSIGVAVTPATLTAVLYSDSPYAEAQEYGLGFPARPFLGPAALFGEALLVASLEDILISLSGGIASSAASVRAAGTVEEAGTVSSLGVRQKTFRIKPK